MRGDRATVPRGRSLVILAGTLCLWAPWTSVPLLSLAISLTFILLGGALVVLLWRGDSGREVALRPLLWVLVATAVAGALATLLVLVAQGAPLVPVALVVAVLLVLAPQAILTERAPGRAVLAAVAGSMLALVVTGVWCWDGLIDVELYVRGGVDALAHGQSPYGITIANPYSPSETDRYYGPGVVQHGRTVYGYPYLPAALLIDLPVHVVADAVWMHLAVLAGAVVLAWRLASDQLGRAAVLALGLSPATAFLVLNYWIEAVMVGLLVLSAWGLARGRAWAVVIGVGMLFVSKQYALFFAPAVWTVLRRAGRRATAGAVALGVVVMGVFVLMDPVAFYRSAVEFQFKQPFRDDAISLLPSLRLAVGDAPSWLLGVLPFLGLVVSAVVAARTRPGPTGFCLVVGLGLLSSVLVSKVGFVNYFVFIGSALLLAGVTWPEDDPLQMREPSSQGSRGAFGISRTR